MRFAVYLPIAMPLVAAVAARPIAEHLRPRTAAWMVTAAALVLAVASLGALGLLAAAGLAQLPALAAMKGYPIRLVQHEDPASLSLGALAAVLLAAAVGNGLHAGARRLVALLDVMDRAAGLDAPGQVVVLDDGSCDAYAVPGLPGRIVVSRAMLEALRPEERVALIAHERAHLQRWHVAFVGVTRCAAAANPFLRPLQRTVEYAVERWADELAADVTGDRRRTAVAIAKAALARDGRSSAAPIASLGIAGAASAAGQGGPVPRRVAALLAPPVRSHPAALLLAVVGLLVAVGCAAEGARDLHALFLMVGLLH
ncbi:M56 family metallopeptidase [Amnibacterium sp. CER49]|uniref:M56 family metallopeptidase n=1 Tax=Amnibacterium sp. CER49 TaxID=3039161 RepID=UPI00244BF8D6|nr:M56 family metallopeptidase [Amnibacterium sp. CER49]MDH2444170.1 M56 family metallopeptidase [Amnibacterium sp. CER49]